MTRYLLGGLPEEEQALLERQLLSDDDCFEELLALEDELRYDYAQGSLSAEERERFENRFLRTRVDRNRVETAQAILRTIAGRQKRSAGARFFDLFFSMRPLGWAMAAVGLFLFASSGWLFLETARLRNQLEEAAAKQGEKIEALRKEAVEERDRAERLRKELEQERQQASEKPRPAVTFLSLSLSPGIARDSGASPRRLAIPAGTEMIRLELALRTDPEHVGYRATLRNADGAELSKRDDLRPDGKILRFSLPARILSPGDYEILLEGRAPGGDFEEIGDYYFTIAAR
jgi:hypothetical protein